MIMILYLIESFISITSVCKPGFYDSTTGCLSKCGHCKDNATCDKESGKCSDGCEPNFKDPYCQGTQIYSDFINSIYCGWISISLQLRYTLKYLFFYMHVSVIQMTLLWYYY